MYDLTQVCVYWYLSFTVVQVGFVQAMYTVIESDGQVSVCINISGAVLNRNVTVFVSTNDTASCEWFLCLRWLIPFVYKMAFMYANSDTERIYNMNFFAILCSSWWLYTCWLPTCDLQQCSLSDVYLHHHPQWFYNRSKWVIYCDAGLYWPSCATDIVKCQCYYSWLM